MSDLQDRLSAAVRGRYRIDRQIGAGGMATVYLADDLRHGRKVALKVLRPELAAVVGAERFLAEIRTTANLQHPHILPLFDSGEADSFLFYVMPHVDGESLRDRLDREKQLGVQQALELARKVAGALDYAHGRGIVHRDIKPGNILLSEQGEPLVADFGIALAVAQAGGGRITETGLSLGTPHYMSPEQATGEREVDARSDVYSLGCVLYEMLAGQPPYTAPTAQAVLAKILTADPPSITSERKTVPLHIDAALAKSLEKLPADRFVSAAAFAAALGNAGFRHDARESAVDATVRSGRRGARAGAGDVERWKTLTRAFAAAAVVLGALAVWLWFRPTPYPPVLVAAIDVSDLGSTNLLTDGGEILVSPDGSRFAVVGARLRDPIYWRPRDASDFRPVAGIDPVAYAAFSPDGEEMVYSPWWRGRLERVSLAGGAPQFVTRVPGPRASGLYWGDDGNIVFTQRDGLGLYIVPADGGDAERILDEDTPVRNPRLLPGGRALIYTDVASQSTHLLDLVTDSVRMLRRGALDAVFIETGHLVYADAAGTLWAIAFDPDDGVVTGNAVALLDGVSVTADHNARYSISRDGTLVYGTGYVPWDPNHRLAIMTFDGSMEFLDLDPGEVTSDMSWSRDGRSIAWAGIVAGDDDPDIWVYDIESAAAPRRLTFEGDHVWPIFSPDGNHVVFSSRREGTAGGDIFVRALNDDTPERALITMPGDQAANDWPSNDLIVFESIADSALWMLDLSDPDSARAEVYLPSDGAAMYEVVVSPDGTLAAYTVEEDAGPQVYVRRFPQPGAPTLISHGDGHTSSWSRDGDILYYWSGGVLDSLWAARIRTDPVPGVVGRDLLLAGRFAAEALHPDGDRLLVAVSVEDSTAARDRGRERFVVVTNFFRLIEEGFAR